MIRTLVVDFSEANQEPQYQFNTEVLGGRLLKFSFSDALASPWIAVSERQPNKYEQVLVFNGEAIDVAVYNPGSFHGVRAFYWEWAITHWMPIPELPEVD